MESCVASFPVDGSEDKIMGLSRGWGIFVIVLIVVTALGIVGFALIMIRRHLLKEGHIGNYE